MPAKTKNKRYTGCYFTWKLYRRDGVWWADGRSNPVDVGRRSLGTRDFEEARKVVEHLDLKMAIEHGLAEPQTLPALNSVQLTLAEGRKLYEQHIGRHPMLGGLRESSRLRYGTVLDNFLPYASRKGISSWNRVSAAVLQGYLDHLVGLEYAYRTQYLEITTLKQVNGFLVRSKALPPECKIDLKLKKPSGTDTYCWSKAEVKAMLAHCGKTPEKRWLHDVLITLAFTGMRIGEVIGLRWSNIDFVGGMINLMDESSSNRMKADRQRQTTKGGLGRAIPIFRDLRPVLKEIPRHSDGYVFHGPLNARLKADTARCALKRDVLEPLADQFPTPRGEIGFATGRLHSFRHFFCSLCAAKGVEQSSLMQWLGHRDSKMTQHYFHLRSEEARLQIERISLSD